MKHGIRGLLAGDLVDLTDLPSEVLPALQVTPSSALGSCRHRLAEADIPLALALLREHGINYMIYIGGNDSADTSHRLSQAAAAEGYDLRIIAVPKTIDNDLPVTDHSPGYGSAARYMAIAALESTLDTRAMPDIYPVKFIEAMGRHSGWLTAATALAATTGWDTPDLIYIPEHPKDLEEMLDEIRSCYSEKGHVVVALSENVKCRDGRPVTVAGLEALGEGAAGASGGEPSFIDSFGHSYYRGVGAGWVMSQLVTKRLDLRSRVDAPGTLQRMSQAHQSEVDLIESEECGRAAVRAALSGTTDQMVILERPEGTPYRCTIGMAELTEIANVEKKLPQGFITKTGNHVTQAFIDYALPLIGAPLPQYVELQT
jgi:6-phosphofructokinase 1